MMRSWLMKWEKCSEKFPGRVDGGSEGGNFEFMCVTIFLFFFFISPFFSSVQFIPTYFLRSPGSGFRFHSFFFGFESSQLSCRVQPYSQIKETYIERGVAD